MIPEVAAQNIQNEIGAAQMEQLGSANLIVRHYQDICYINGNNVRNKCDAIDAEFMALYPSSETDEYLPLVKALGDAAWGGYVQLFEIESSPLHNEIPPTSTLGKLGHFTRISHYTGGHIKRDTECFDRMLSLAIHLCLRSRVCAEVLLDCATTHGATDELHYLLLNDAPHERLYTHSMLSLLKHQPALLGRSPVLALGCANRCLSGCLVYPATFPWFVAQVKANPTWFALPALVQHLTRHGFADVADAVRALRVLACLDSAFLRHENVNLVHFIDALKNNKKHLARVEVLTRRIEHPDNVDMEVEKAAAFAVA